ncbi:MAG: hypothetical protein PHQ59_03895 [Candidatus Daviesbacteria bacterium]|nr:hypothetical protein [Candidatus Daviesbacteria bacterium]
MHIFKNHLFLISCVLLLFYSFSILYRSDSSFDQDLGRHLKTGEIIINSLSVPYINLFSYTNANFPFINHHFLFGVIIYLWSKFFDLQLFLHIKILIILTAVLLTFLNTKRTQSILLLPLGYLFLHVLRERTDLRPEIFSFLFTSVTVWVLERFYSNKSSKLIFILPIIQFFWINIHIYFFVGFLLQGIYLIDLFLRKEVQKFKALLFIFVGSLILCLINPNTINGLLYPLQIFSNYGYSIAENQNLFLLERLGFTDPNFIFVKLCVLLIIFTLIISILKKPYIIKNNLISLQGIFLALVSIRGFPYIFYLSFPFIFLSLNNAEVNKKSLALFICTTFLLIIESAFYLNGSYYKENKIPAEPKLILQENGKKALDFLLQNDLPQPIYNNFDIGSYIIYRAYPKYKVFVDGRPEAYPADFFTNIYIPSQSDYSYFKELDNKYKFQTVVFSITDQTPWGKSFLRSIIKDDSFATVYLDNFIIILIKRDQLQAVKLAPIL